jgi:tripartite-type tricarboxylate transporter receptor subunit TctC
MGDNAMRRIRMLGLVLAAVLSMVAARADYPDRTIRIVVPYTPGGFNDTLGRIVANKFSEASGVQTVVENRPGGGTLIGTDSVAKAPPTATRCWSSPSRSRSIRHSMRTCPATP